MNCPYCGGNKQEVIGSTRTNDGKVRRRRKCESCSGRFNTVETVWTVIEGRVVVHPDGKRGKFDAERLGQSIREATEGRLLEEETRELISDAKEMILEAPGEIPVSVIVDTVTSLLEGRDWLAPFRYAIYHSQNPEGVIDRWLQGKERHG
ncbi:MAG: transcriptional regulator NrdR [Patescibacteria group bacterium]